jgi:hypothetical protein
MQIFRKRPLFGLAVGLAIVAIVLFAFCPIHLSLGDLKIEKSLSRVKKTDDWSSGFSHTGWDGPTGTYSSGEIYTFRIGDWLWRLDIYNKGLPEL